MISCECGTPIDSDFDIECFIDDDSILCEPCRVEKGVEECLECSKWLPMAPDIDPWGKQHGFTSMCAQCLEDYDPTPEAYDSEPAVSAEERYRMAAKQKDELR